MQERLNKESIAADPILLRIDKKIKNHSLREAIDARNRYGNNVLVYDGASSRDLAASHGACLMGISDIKIEMMDVSNRDGSIMIVLCPVKDGVSDFDKKFFTAIHNANGVISVLGGNKYIPSSDIEASDK